MLRRIAEASLTLFGYDQILVYTLCPDNGGNSGKSYSAQLFTLRLRGPFGAAVRAGFSLVYRSLSAISALSRPLQSLCLFYSHGLYANVGICQVDLSDLRTIDRTPSPIYCHYEYHHRTQGAVQHGMTQHCHREPAVLWRAWRAPPMPCGGLLRHRTARSDRGGVISSRKSSSCGVVISYWYLSQKIIRDDCQRLLCPTLKIRFLTFT